MSAKWLDSVEFGWLSPLQSHFFCTTYVSHILRSCLFISHASFTYSKDTRLHSTVLVLVRYSKLRFHGIVRYDNMFSPYLTVLTVIAQQRLVANFIVHRVKTEASMCTVIADFHSITVIVDAVVLLRSCYHSQNAVKTPGKWSRIRKMGCFISCRPVSWVGWHLR